MKLVNADEALPEVFYLFVDQRSLMARNNLAVGSFSSAAFNSFSDLAFIDKYVRGTVRYLPYQVAQSDLLAVSPFLMSTVGQYRVEYDAEVFREKNHPFYPSRLSAMYAFGTWSSWPRPSASTDRVTASCCRRQCGR
ncbi:hypothetical protein ACSFBX_31720 [Variovorax sp. RB2P76]|uniref:hypothetical protein n=1 Tax=Variovorax sp. RB2P76 TaxID=3443736 RepID=UPI003F45DE0E